MGMLVNIFNKGQGALGEAAETGTYDSIPKNIASVIYSTGNKKKNTDSLLSFLADGNKEDGNKALGSILTLIGKKLQ